MLNSQGLNEYKEIIAIEPDKENQLFIENKILKNMRIINKGAWSKKATLSFASGEQSNSRVMEEGDTLLEVDTIDNMLGDMDATFIKMDVEGAELNALRGAENQIKKNRPKLAICVYHKKEDLIEIPKYLKQLVPDYKFYLRNYQFFGSDAVLYAI